MSKKIKSTLSLREERDVNQLGALLVLKLGKNGNKKEN
jgi:hypothetical protein